MTAAQLNRAVARATGETLSTIQRRGFSPMSLRPRRSSQPGVRRRACVHHPQPKEPSNVLRLPNHD
jgi:hypothetical protein